MSKRQQKTVQKAKAVKVKAVPVRVGEVTTRTRREVLPVAKVRLTDMKIAALIVEHKGNASGIVSSLPAGTLSRVALLKRIRKTPELNELLVDQKSRRIDLAEELVDTDIHVNKNVNTAKWFLEQQGGELGYGRQGISVNLVQKDPTEAMSDEELEKIATGKK